ncbi:LacI family DNA-binding transcriptional regulator [Microbacterium sp. EST19A]|uniref:LacI family DNA-binding transcriptional regulator n=1 Tax=Microbacterium sp. EST19A TaxID=2862681 RepID=UPI001CBE68E6|nr:LacI family DNA-binding transcriptional regulator [Microbacterium sp. EST19A]
MTIYAIAEQLQISPATVSRAYSRPDLVKAEVRAEIFATAEKMGGYHPNKTARRLSTGRTGSIGLFVPDITNPFFPPLIRAVQRTAAASDTTVILIDGGQDTDNEIHLIERLAAQVDGLVIASPRSPAQKLIEATGSVPTVLLDRQIDGMASVICDRTTALLEAGQHLLDLGHRAIALLRGTDGSWAAEQRTRTIQDWATTAPVDLITLGPYDASFQGGLGASADLLETQATAAFAFDDLTACGVIAGLDAAQKSVPHDVSLVGCDDVLLAQVLTPGLTTISSPNDRMGELAMRQLELLLANGTAAPVTTSGALVVRQSTGPVRPR